MADLTGRFNIPKEVRLLSKDEVSDLVVLFELGLAHCCTYKGSVQDPIGMLQMWYRDEVRRIRSLQKEESEGDIGYNNRIINEFQQVNLRYSTFYNTLMGENPDDLVGLDEMGVY